jgi:MarR family transcriptional regulator, organic hydroperoxide resistance regulator
MESSARFDEMGLGTRLRVLLAALDGELQTLYDEMGVPFRPRFYPVVQHLLAEGASAVGELAARTGVSQPAMTQTVAEMVRCGLLERGSGRRLRLTADGRELCLRLAPVWRATAAAASELDRELPAPLGATLIAALSRLAEKPFQARILTAMAAE